VVHLSERQRELALVFGAAGLEFASVGGCQALKFKEGLRVALRVLLLRFLCQSKRSEMFRLFANVASSRLVFGHSLSAIASGLFLFETFFRPLPGLIGIHSRSLV